LMVFGEPPLRAARIFSMVGRSPARSRTSAARSTSLAVTPREWLPYGLGASVTFVVYQTIQTTYV
jgi:hypothetical protein